MWTRLVLILLLLLAPAAALATPACCANELPAQGCAPQGNCPTDVDGNCAVPQWTHPPATAPLGTSFTIVPASITGSILRAPDAAQGDPDRPAMAAPDSPPPLYLRLQSFRN